VVDGQEQYVAIRGDSNQSTPNKRALPKVERFDDFASGLPAGFILTVESREMCQVLKM
jgi:hypothetical protein